MDQQPALDEQLVRRLAAAVRSAAVYGGEHPLARRGIATLAAMVDDQLHLTPQITVAFLGDDVLIGHTRLRASSNLQGLVRHFRELDVEKLTFTKGVRPEDMMRLVNLLAERTDRPFGDRLREAHLEGIGVGLITTGPGDGGSESGLAAARSVYSAAVAASEQVWNAALSGEAPDPDAARTIIDALAKAVAQDRTSMMALTAVKTHDPYTFTHMVNVALLTMAQARSLGLSEPLIREFGLSGLMHDVGKVKVPTEILTKPAALSQEERTIMQRHVVDGAQILRKTPGMPALAPVVAFEHHLRLDLSGYPEHIGTRKLNLCTMLVSISDVFDALRSNRAYREGLPANRVRSMLSHQSGVAFEPTLLRRFITLTGLFPIGSTVRMRSGAVGVVVAEHARDVSHPVVRLVLTDRGEWLPEPLTLDTAAPGPGQEPPDDVLEAIDPDGVGIDPVGIMSL